MEIHFVHTYGGVQTHRVRHAASIVGTITLINISAYLKKDRDLKTNAKSLEWSLPLRLKKEAKRKISRREKEVCFGRPRKVQLDLMLNGSINCCMVPTCLLAVA